MARRRFIIVIRYVCMIFRIVHYNFNYYVISSILLGDKWRRQRKIITPTFHFKILEQFVNIFNAKGDILVKKIFENTEKIFDIYPFITLCSLDIICGTKI